MNTKKSIKLTPIKTKFTVDKFGEENDDERVLLFANKLIHITYCLPIIKMTVVTF